MKECSKFVCIAAENINFLIPSSEVITSVYCNGENYFWNNQFIFENNTIPYIDFYNDNSNKECFGDVHYTETALVIKNTKLFDNQQYFAVITSKECSVMEIEYRTFSLFSKKFENKFKKKGFIACCFKDHQIYYLIDVEDFLKNFSL